MSALIFTIVLGIIVLYLGFTKNKAIWRLSQLPAWEFH